MKNLLKYFTLFLVGGTVYVLMEIGFRGFSHYSMFLLGALCFILIGYINEFISWDLGLVYQSLIGGLLIVTPLEFIFGLIFNSSFTVWDYRGVPLNFMGQVCLPFSVIWCFVSIIGIVLDDVLRYYIFKEEKPRYKLLGGIRRA
jgi:uncharacterized membrane protein